MNLRDMFDAELSPVAQECAIEEYDRLLDLLVLIAEREVDKGKLEVYTRVLATIGKEFDLPDRVVR